MVVLRLHSVSCSSFVWTESRGAECVQLGSLMFMSLLLADDVVLLASLVVDLWHALDRLVAECELAKIRINISKSEVVALC